MRIDQWLVKSGRASSRALAQTLIKSGAVKVREPEASCWKLVDKPSFDVTERVSIEIASEKQPQYVSRAGEKLAGALVKSALSVKDCVCLDMGQSTGGFTDCLIQQGAKQVVGVDVGKNQLAPKLRDHPQVYYFEGVNGRAIPDHLFDELAPEGFDIVVMDVSFISQTLILPELVKNLKTSGYIVSLVKPQFEVGKAGIGKGGIVRDKSLYKQVEEKIRRCGQELGLICLHYFESPIQGGDGNREYFAIFQEIR